MNEKRATYQQPTSPHHQCCYLGPGVKLIGYSSPVLTVLFRKHHSDDKDDDDDDGGDVGWS